MKPAMWLALAAAFVSMAVVFISKTFADAAFLGEFGVKYVPHMFIAQAVTMVASSSGYSALIKRLPAAPVDAAILLSFVVAAVLGPLAIAAGGPAVFVLALVMTVLATLTNLAVWNAATAVVSGRRSRWFLPRVGAASTAGATLGSLGSSALVGAFDVEALGPMLAILAAATLVLRGLLVARTGEWRKWRRDLNSEKPAKSVREGGDEFAKPQKRLVTALAVAALLESFVVAIVEFGFKREVTESFTTQDDIGVFLALFYGGSNAALLLMQLVASSRLLSTRSLRFSLAMEPVAIAGISVAWAMAPALVLGTVARGLESLLKFGVARPAQEVALTPMPEVDRKRWKVLLRGAFNQGGAAAAGVALIVAAPLLSSNQAIIPAMAACSAVFWLIAQRAAAARYLDALGSALGLRRLSIRDQRDTVIDREGLSRIVEMTGAEDRRLAGIAAELLATVVHDSRMVATYLGLGPTHQRIALYKLLTQRPHRTCIGALRVAVTAEPIESEAASYALDALAAHDDNSRIPRALDLIDGSAAPNPTQPLIWSAWSYLARVGGFDDEPDKARLVVERALIHDGARAADILQALVMRGAVLATEAEEMCRQAAAAESRPARVQGVIACAHLGWPNLLRTFVEALESREPGYEQAVAHLGAESLRRLLELDRYRHASARARTRLLRGLRTSDIPELVDLIANELTDENPAVRELAARTILKRMREHGDTISRKLAEQSLTAQLDRFEVYVRARPGYIATGRESQMEVAFRSQSTDQLTAESFFIDELERRTEISLSRLCTTLALFGNPSSVYAAERSLRAPTFKRRRQALDILQEVARGRFRTRLLELLDIYLLPPRTPPPEARDKVCAMDPWLDRCANYRVDPDMAKLWALRATALFDHVDGELLGRLAAHTTDVVIEAGQHVVSEGDPGDALFVVMSGSVEVTREGQRVAALDAGQSFGELALLDGLPRVASVRALEKSSLLRLPRDTFDRALAEHPEIGLGLVRALVRWLRQTSEQPALRITKH